MSGHRYVGYPTRSAYESARADAIRGELFELLGPCCGGCECSLHGVAWEFNHLYVREWVPRKLSKYRRNKRYLQEAIQGLGDLRCPACNMAYRPRLAAPVAVAEAGGVPF